VVEEVGAEVAAVAPGDFVISPFSFSDNSCQSCRNGFQPACDHVAFFSSQDAAGVATVGAQSELTRIPMADCSLPNVLSGAINPGLAFDLELGLDVAALGYAAMDERRAIKSLLRP
jgi:threonine dehydrogenase-like Zn-dependent dehydrogenase